MRHALKLSALIVVCLTLAQPIPAQTRNVKISYKETTLKNGLRVITVEDHTAPVVSTAVTYNVGSRNEHKGKTGYAHLFEHMMFKGSENVGAGEHPVLVRNNGGSDRGRCAARSAKIC